MSYYGDQEAYWAEKEAKKEKSKAKSSTNEPHNSYFELNFKNVIIYLSYIFICAVIGICTLGIALPWLMCSFYRWRASHTFIDGQPLEFTGSGTTLFAESHYFLFLILTIITCGLAFPLLFINVNNYLKSRYNHVIIPDSEQELRIGNYFAHSLGYFILSSLVAVISLGAALPWVLNVYYKRGTLHTYYKGVSGNFGLKFTANGGSELFFKGGYGLLWLLGMICTYFYSPTQSTILLVLAAFLLPSLAIISVYSWKTKNTHVTKRSFIE